MHTEILSPNQKKLLPLLSNFADEFGLVGGTAIALYLGHRGSIDFDLFSKKEFSNAKIRKTLVEHGEIQKIILDEKDQYELIFNEVRLTFLYYPFEIKFGEDMGPLKMPNLLTLAAMKAYALGRRHKWKDYVDLYYIIKDHFSVSEISTEAKRIFGDEYSDKNFRIQLAYHDDIDFSEEVTYLPGYEVDAETIKETLKKLSIQSNG